MRSRPWLLIALAIPLLAADPAPAPDGGGTGAVPDGGSADAGSGGSGASSVPWVSSEKNEIVVWGDLFARWDDTRWLVATEIETPFPLTLAREKNGSFFTTGYQVRTILACSKSWKLNNKHYEVDCRLEDFGIQAAIADRYTEGREALAQSVLDEIDAKLTNAALQLQVSDDGRVTNVDLEGLDKDSDREQMIYETLRQVLSRVVVGFDMKMQKLNQLNEGKWIEYHSALMSMPLPSGSTATRASSTLIHYLNRYKGQILVQSIGKGMIEVPPLGASGETDRDRLMGEDALLNAANADYSSGGKSGDSISTDLGSGPGAQDDGGGSESSNGWTFEGYTYETNLKGVSIYDPDEGFMTERVWVLEGKPTAAAGLNTRKYWHAGRITMLGETDHPDVGATRVIAPRGQSVPGVPSWVSIEAGQK